MITSAIKAHGERDVAIIDIHGAFLHAWTGEEIYMLLRCSKIRMRRRGV